MGRIVRPLEPMAYRSPEWYALRANSVGGSDLGPILGCSPWQSRDELLAAKLSGERLAQSPAMEAGSLLEGMVVRRTVDALGGFACDIPDGVWRSDRYHYTPDALACLPEGDVLVEVKTSAFKSAKHGWGAESPDRDCTDDVPMQYAAQVQWGLMLSGLSAAYVALMPRVSLGLHIYRVEADADIAHYLTTEADRFLADLDRLRMENAA